MNEQAHQKQYQMFRIHSQIFRGLKIGKYNSFERMWNREQVSKIKLPYNQGLPKNWMDPYAG